MKIVHLLSSKQQQVVFSKQLAIDCRRIGPKYRSDRQSGYVRQEFLINTVQYAALTQASPTVQAVCYALGFIEPNEQSENDFRGGYELKKSVSTPIFNQLVSNI